MINILKLQLWLQDFMSKNPPSEWPPANVIYELLSDSIVKDMQSTESFEIIDLRPGELRARDLN